MVMYHEQKIVFGRSVGKLVESFATGLVWMEMFISRVIMKRCPIEISHPVYSREKLH